MRRASSRFLPPLAGGLSLLLAPAAAMQPGHLPASTSAVDATGTTIKVTNCNDSGPGSLRAAVANALDPDTIDLTGLNCHRIGLTSGPIVIPQAVLSLVGPGKNALTIDGNLRGQVIRYENTAGRLRISGMTIARGFKQNDASSPYGGGCIYADYGVLELRNVRVSHCHACGSGARSPAGVAASTPTAWSGCSTTKSWTTGQPGALRTAAASMRMAVSWCATAASAATMRRTMAAASM